MDSVTDFGVLDKLQLYLESKKETVFRISALSKEGIPNLIDSLGRMVKRERLHQIDHQVKFMKSKQFKNSIWDD